jgi:hypothetical protein
MGDGMCAEGDGNGVGFGVLVRCMVGSTYLLTLCIMDGLDLVDKRRDWRKSVPLVVPSGIIEMVHKLKHRVALIDLVKSTNP